MKVKLKILSLFLIFSLLMLSILNIPVVLAENPTYVMTMEDEVVNQQIVSSWLNSYPVSVGGQDFNVTNVKAFEGSNSFIVSQITGDGWWNYTYSDEVDVISNWSVFCYRDLWSATTGQLDFKFYNSENQLVIHLYITDDQFIYFIRHDSVSVQMSNSFGTEEWNGFGFAMSSNDSVRYFDKLYTGEASKLTDSSPRNILDNYAITSLHITNTLVRGGYNLDYYLDLHNVTLSTKFVEEPTGEEVEGYSVIGDLSGIGLFSITNSRFLEIQKNTLMKGYVKAIDLWVDSYYFDVLGNDLNDMTLKLNGAEKGNPTSATLYGAGYIVRWLFDIPQELDDERLLCEFRSLTDYWYVAWASYDIDLDGDTAFCNHNQPNYYDGYYNQFSLVGYDLGYRIWGLFETIKPSYDDVVITAKDTYNQYESIDIITMVSTIENQNYLYIYNATYTLLSTFVINSYTNTFTYNSPNSGTIYLNLTRNSVVVAQKTLTITPKVYDYLIYTNPNPSKPSLPFDISYIYNNSDYNGTLYVYDSNFNFVDSWFLPDDSPSVQTISYVLTDIGLYYFRMVVDVSATEKEIKYTHLHRVGVAVFPNEIKASGETLNVGDTLTIYGTHNFIGNEVYVNIDDEYSRYVGQSNTFSFQYVPLKLKIYTCNLVLKVSDTSEYVLDSITFTTLGDIPVVPSPPEWWEIMKGVHPFLKAIVGTIVVLVLTLLPMFIVLGFRSKTKIDIPPMTYALSGSVGIVFCIYAGLFDFWVLFFIIAVGIIVTVLFWIKGGGLK